MQVDPQTCLPQFPLLDNPPLPSPRLLSGMIGEHWRGLPPGCPGRWGCDRKGAGTRQLSHEQTGLVSRLSRTALPQTVLMQQPEGPAQCGSPLSSSPSQGHIPYFPPATWASLCLNMSAHFYPRAFAHAFSTPRRLPSNTDMAHTLMPSSILSQLLREAYPDHPVHNTRTHQPPTPASAFSPSHHHLNAFLLLLGALCLS